jgi:hypothetical protein
MTQEEVSPENEKRIRELERQIAEIQPVVDRQVAATPPSGPTTREMDQLKDWQDELKMRFKRRNRY